VVAVSFALLAAPGDARPLVAIIDSGIARTAELQPVLIAEYDMAAAAPRPAFQPRYDHGTMVATILNREAKGAIDIVSLRIDDPAGCPPKASPPCQGSAAPVADAIRKAIDLGASAINISLSMQDDASIVEAVRDAAGRGIIVVMAAGNNGFDHPANRRMARAGFPYAVLVGALDATGRPWIGTNRPDIDARRGYDYVWRLGVNVPTVTAGGVPAIGTGTSFAVPIETARRLTQAPAGLLLTSAYAGVGGGR
jgi:subtilisin family serine protease